jgi:two-component system, chemotaxis family, chemotaxis protein CheY
VAYNILIVDDSKIIRSVMRRSLELAQLPLGEVFEASNGVEALEYLRQHWIDIVFADIHMPEMNGLELIRAMSRDDLLESVPVVAVSSERRQDMIDELNALGVRAYLKKPFRPEQVRDTVLSLLHPPTAEGGHE